MTPDTTRHSGGSEIGSDHPPPSASASEPCWEAAAAPPPRPALRQLASIESSSDSPPPLPAKEGREKSKLRRELSDSPPPPVPRRPPSSLFFKGAEATPNLTRPRSEEAIPIPCHRPFTKTPSSPMLLTLSSQRLQKNRSSGGEYIWVRPASFPKEGNADEPPAAPPLPPKSLPIHRCEDGASGGGLPSFECSMEEQPQHGTSCSCVNNAIYDYIIPLNLPPDPPERHDSLFLDLHSPDTPPSSTPASPDSPCVDRDIDAVPEAVYAEVSSKSARLPAEVPEPDDHGHSTPCRSLSLEPPAPAHTGLPPQHAATQVRRTWQHVFTLSCTASPSPASPRVGEAGLGHAGLMDRCVT